MLTNSRFSDIQMVVLVVGPGKTEISVHENVLFEASPVFKAAFASNFKESSERSIYLPDDSAILMDTLVQYLYAPRSWIQGVRSTMEHLRLYVLADKYDIVQVKNQVCHWGFFIFETEPPSKAEVKFIYENTTSKMAIRRFLVDSFVWNGDPTWFSDEANCSWLLSVPDFAVDVCAILAKGFVKKAKAHPFKNDTSVYLEEEADKNPKHTK